MTGRVGLLYVLSCYCWFGYAGEHQLCYVIEFEEPSGSNPLVEMMMKVRQG